MPLVGVATTFMGLPGTVPAGTTAFDAVDAALLPTEFVATAVNVYEVPFVSPVTVQAVVGEVATQVKPPGLEVTVYVFIAAPPLLAGAVQVIDAD